MGKWKAGRKKLKHEIRTWGKGGKNFFFFFKEK